MTIKEKLEEAIEDDTEAANCNTIVVGIEPAAEACEAIVDDVAIKYGLFRSGVMPETAKHIVRSSLMEFGKEKAEKDLFEYFKNNIYGK